jgi:hypothetical protein
MIMNSKNRSKCCQNIYLKLTNKLLNIWSKMYSGVNEYAQDYLGKQSQFYKCSSLLFTSSIDVLPVINLLTYEAKTRQHWYKKKTLQHSILKFFCNNKKGTVTNQRKMIKIETHRYHKKFPSDVIYSCTPKIIVIDCKRSANNLQNNIISQQLVK